MRGGVDYEHIRIAEGPAAPVHFTAASVDENNVLHVDFEKNSGMTRAKGSDRVYVYAYCPTLGEGILSAPTTRSSNQLRTVLPDHWHGCGVELWGFVVDGEGRASASAYIEQRAKETTGTASLEDNGDMSFTNNRLAVEKLLAKADLDAPRPPLRT